MGKNLSIENAALDTNLAPIAILNLAQHTDIVGYVHEANTAHVNQALKAAHVQTGWTATAKNQRGAGLQRAADIMQARLLELIILLCSENGKTAANSIAEVRKAIDFLYYYAAQILDLADNTSIQPLCTVLCISPWNFPLATFTGQISAAVVAGNTVIAKPAEQTPLIVALAIQILWQARVYPDDVVQLLPGQGETIRALLVADVRIQGVLFTGSMDVAKTLQTTLAQHFSNFGQPITLIAETGVQNIMIVDSSALIE